MTFILELYQPKTFFMYKIFNEVKEGMTSLKSI